MTTARTLSPADVAADLLDFSEADFAASPAPGVHDREARLLDADFTGVAITAPRHVHVDTQSALPIAIALRCDGGRDWDLPLSDNSLLVASDVHSGRVHVVPALAPAKVLTSRAGPCASRAGPVRPPAEELEDFGAQIAWTEVRSRIDLPWRGGHWSFGLIHFDWLSNRVDVELVGGTAAPAAAATPRSVDPPPAGRVPGAPTYVRLTRTPSAPALGVQFRLTLDERGTASRLVFDAAFVVPARSHMLAAGLRQPDAGQDRNMAAVVPMTLLLVGANMPRPWRRDFAVPAYGAAVQAGERVEGCVCLDAFDGQAAPGAGDYAAYVVLDGAIHGPQPVRVTR
ncbi:MAG: hypothetical protein RLY71_4003 [Pseudomonadota bacterium]|jgi:hypothetical protein